jgi:pyruvate dehydrogenase E2 component (dihydrolipoamide acetyltransferase)
MEAARVGRSLAQAVSQQRRFASAASAALHDAKLSPAARYIANNHRLDVAGIKGTGKAGMIVKGDVLAALSSGAAKAAPSAAPVAAAAAAAPAAPVAPVAPSSTAPVNSNYTDIPLTTMRKVIAKRLTESKQTVPHSYCLATVEIDAVLKMRKQLAKDFNVNVSVNDAVIKAAALALRDVPEANARFDAARGAVQRSPSIDVSVAVATPTGLITPIVTNADGRGLSDINATVKDLATRARAGKLKPQEFQGGSFSISNLGMFGVSAFSAVINPPQSCILAVGAGVPRVVLDEKTQTLRTVTQLSVQLSADRRVVSEAVAAQFLQAFSAYLASPVALAL